MCAWDNFACIVDQFPQSIPSLAFPAYIMLAAVVFAIWFAKKIERM